MDNRQERMERDDPFAGLSRYDLMRLLAGINKLLECESVECLRKTAVDVAASLMPSSSCAWTEVNSQTGYSHGYINTGEDPAVLSQAMSSVADQHPVFNAFKETGDGSARAISDLIPRRRFRAMDLYTRFYSRHRTEDQLGLAMRVKPAWVIGFVINRETWGFTAAEHTLLQSLRPALITTYTKLRCIQDLSTSSDGVDLHEASRTCLVSALRAHGLTPREADVLARICEGLENKAIAVDLGISDGTVRKHVDRIFQKLGVHNRTASVRTAFSLIHE